MRKLKQSDVDRERYARLRRMFRRRQRNEQMRLTSAGEQSMQREVASIEMELRRQKLGRRPPRRWTQVPEMLLTKYLTRPNETGQNEMLETNESILKILKAVESESTKPTPHLHQIKWEDLHKQLESLQAQVHTFQRLLQDEETTFTCALLLYHFSLVKSLTNLIRRPGRFISNSKLLQIDAEISKMTDEEKTEAYPWWASYFLFTKKAFEVLHYVFNWVEESQNIVTNDFQFINYLFCLIPINEADIFIECTTILEDLLTIKTKSMLDLKKIPILKEVVSSCSDAQFPFLCRVIAVIMSDNEITKPVNDTLKAHDEWLLNSTNHAIGDSNQKHLINLKKFVHRLIMLSMRGLNEAENVWRKKENLQSWVASTYVTTNSVNLLRQSLEQMYQEQNDLPRSEDPNGNPIPTPLDKLKIHNEKMYKIEALFILTLLLCGNYKDSVQRQVSKLSLIPGLNKLFQNFIWKSDSNDEPPLINPPNDDCSADTALKVQFLRLVHSVCDHHPNKYLLLSKRELLELKESKNQNPSIDYILENNLYCQEDEGLLSNILKAMKEASETSTLLFWIARAVESFLRGPTCKQDQGFYLKRGILKHLLHLLLDIRTSPEVSQGHFDLLAELMKFNEDAFRDFEEAVGDNERFQKFMNMASASLVDSNMFVRCATLTFYKFQSENVQIKDSRLLSYMSSKEVRANLIAKLIELITPDTLNQENVSCLNTSLVFMITARREGTLAFYLSDLAERRNEQGVPLLENYQELLEFWLSHYSLTFKEKDCQSLEQGTGIKFDEWTSTVKILLGKHPPDSNDDTLVNYLRIGKDRSISRDKSVSRLT